MKKREHRYKEKKVYYGYAYVCEICGALEGLKINCVDPTIEYRDYIEKALKAVVQSQFSNDQV